MALIATAVLVLTVLRRWQRQRAVHETAVEKRAPSKIDDDDPYVQRLRQELEELR